MKINPFVCKMTTDFSKKGRENFYKEMKEKLRNLEADQENKEIKYSIVVNYLKSVLAYENMSNNYNSQLEILWDLKKRLNLAINHDKTYIGGLTESTKTLKEGLEKHENMLKKLSNSFSKDLEEIMREDPDIMNIDINKN